MTILLTAWALTFAIFLLFVARLGALSRRVARRGERRARRMRSRTMDLGNAHLARIQVREPR